MSTPIALTGHFETFANGQVRAGRFSSVHDVVCAGLRLLEESQRLEAEKLGSLRSAIAEGLTSGPGHDAATVFSRLEAKYTALTKGRDAERQCA